MRGALAAKTVRAMVACAGACAALVGGVREARAQLVVGTDVGTSAQITLIDLSGVNPPRLLVQGITCDGMTADEANQVLYWTSTGGSTARKLYKASYATSGMLTPVIVGSIAGTMSAIAWDSSVGQLIGFDTAGRVWVLNTAQDTPNPGAPATRVQQYTMPEGMGFYGGDYDPVTGAFFGAFIGDATAPGRYRIGMYRYDKPLATPTMTFVAPYPDNEFIGFRGLAIGNGRVFLVGGTGGFFVNQPASPSQVYNIATGVYETALSIPISDNITEAAWAPGLIAPPAGLDLGVSMGGPSSCTIGAGQDLKLSVHVENYGAVASGPVTVTVDLPPASVATFASATPAPTTQTASQLTFSLPSIGAYGAGAYANVEIHLTAHANGSDVAVTAAANGGGEEILFNNSATYVYHTSPLAPATSSIRGVFSADPTRASSLIPGLGGARFVDFYEPYASPDGSWWAVVASTNGPFSNSATANNLVIVRSATGGVPQVLVQRNVTVTSPPSGRAGFIDGQVSINNAGTVAFSDEGGPSWYLSTTSDGVTFNEIARQGGAIPALPGLTYGNRLGNVHIFNNGQVAFSARTSVSGQAGHFVANGTGVLAQQGVTVPAGASGPLGNYWNPGGSVGYFNTGYDATGAHSIYMGQISTEPEATSYVMVVDGTVAVQEGVTQLAPGITPNLVGEMSMGPDGTWMYPDRSTTRQDFIVRGHGTAIDQVYKTGDAIAVGETETWSDVRATASAFTPSDTFFTYNSDANGHYVIGGYTSSADVFTDSVLVYDNRVVIARENDPVDLDGNGIFDDNVYIRSFVRTGATGRGYGPIAFTNDHAILVNVTLRDGESALCEQTDGNFLWAVVRIPLPVEGACCVGTQCTVASQAACAGSYHGDWTTCGTAGNPTACCPANFDGAGGLGVQDIFAFLNAWFAGDARADFNHAGGLGVQDIFDFLSAWFAGC